MVISSVDGHINYLPFCTFGMQIVAEHMFPLAKKGPGQPFASPLSLLPMPLPLIMRPTETMDRKLHWQFQALQHTKSRLI